MSIQLEATNKPPSIILEKVDLPVVVPASEPIQVEKVVQYVGGNVEYNISVVDSLGGAFILLAAVLILVRLFGGLGMIGSLVRGVTAVVGGTVLFVYCFSMAIL